jgi:hypothetical protein
MSNLETEECSFPLVPISYFFQGRGKRLDVCTLASSGRQRLPCLPHSHSVYCLTPHGVCAPHDPSRPLAATVGCNMCNTRSTFEISRCNTCKLQHTSDDDEYFKHASETVPKTPKNHLKTIANMHNIKIKHLQYMCETYATSK